MSDSDVIEPISAPHRRYRSAILAVALVAIGLSMTVAGGFWGSGDSSNPLDPSHFGAGTAESAYCRQFNTWYGPVC